MKENKNSKTLPDLSIIWALAAVFGYAVFLFAPQVFNDGDTYFHIAIGEWVLNHHAVFYTDLFSYTFLGSPWMAHEWLSEVAMAFAYRLAGWDGLAVLCGSALALTLWLLARDLSRVLDRLPLILVLILAGSCISPHLLARPHILVLPIMEIWAAALIFARARKKAPSLFLTPLITLWANMHGSVMFGVLLVLPFAFEALLETKDQAFAVLRDWGIFFVCALAAGAITPYGWHTLTLPFALMQMSQLSVMNEWQSVDFGKLQPLELALMATLYAFFLEHTCTHHQAASAYRTAASDIAACAV